MVRTDLLLAFESNFAMLPGVSGAIGLPGQLVTAPTENGRVLDGLEPAALEAVRSAALACWHHVGRGDGGAADAAATDAMRVRHPARRAQDQRRGRADATARPSRACRGLCAAVAGAHARALRGHGRRGVT
jgi:hypothetical protein